MTKKKNCDCYKHFLVCCFKGIMLGLMCFLCFLFCMLLLFALIGMLFGDYSNANATELPQSFIIGNSLSEDTRPWELPNWETGDRHYRGGQSAWYIYNNPEDQQHQDGTRWDQVTKSYDWLTIQFDAYPLERPTFEQDLESVLGFIESIPTENILLYTGWQYHTFDTEPLSIIDYESGATNVNTHTPAYYEALRDAIQLQHPTANVQISRHLDVWYSIAKNPPFLDWNSADNYGLYRDAKHATQGNGQWLAHNLVREAYGLPLQPAVQSQVNHSIQPEWEEWIIENIFTPDVTDGYDFLSWQVGNELYSFQEWEERFGNVPLSSSRSCGQYPDPCLVPEPSTLVLGMFFLSSYGASSYFLRRVRGSHTS